jgi:molybdopterin-guanine dinucleotide biosynthesis protein A
MTGAGAPGVPATAVTGIVLAGGQGRRMGGVDKGWVQMDGRPLVSWVLERLAPQVRGIVLNANQNVERYAALGHPVVQDAVTGFAGPLAGLHAALAAVASEWAVSVPCDSPFLPGDLVSRLSSAATAAQAQVAVARTFDRVHPVFALVRRDVRGHLGAFLEAGGRKIDAWYATLTVVEVGFDDEADAFANINTAAELAAAHPRPMR